MTSTLASSGEPFSLKSILQFVVQVFWIFLFLQVACFSGYVSVVFCEVLVDEDIWAFKFSTLF